MEKKNKIILKISVILTAFLFIHNLGYSQMRYIQKGCDINGEESYDMSGFSVSISADGNTIAVGATNGKNGSGASTGKTKVYNWKEGIWQQIGTDIYGEEDDDDSGCSVNLSPDGNHLAIGAPDNCNQNGERSGQTRVFVWNDTAWLQEGADIYGESQYDRSGISVCLNSDGKTVVTGAINTMTGIDTGYVRVFTWNDTAWLQIGDKIIGENENDYTGWSVSSNGRGDVIAFGEHANDGNGLDAGQVRIYKWNDTIWEQIGDDIEGEQPGDYFGGSVSLDSSGKYIAIGGPGHNTGWTDIGHVKVYYWNDTSWTIKGNEIEGEASYAYCGTSVCLSPDANKLAVGANGYNKNGERTGYVQVYDWITDIWVQKGNTMNGIQNGGDFGYSLDMSDDGNTIVVGAFGNDENGTNAGQVKVYTYVDCDSLNTSSSIFDTVCGDYLSPGGKIYSVSGQYVDTISNKSGCDSIITINLAIIGSTSFSSLYDTLCNDRYISPGGKTYSNGGVYVDTIPNMSGCDSIITINLFSKKTYSEIYDTACYYYTSPSGKNWTASGIYVDTLPNAANCDSLITINLIINTVDTSVIKTGNNLVANASSAEFQWLDCNNNYAMINGETSSTFTPVIDGNYSVEVTQNNCIDTSNCYQVTINTNIIRNDFGDDLKVFPNPTDGMLNISLGKKYNVTKIYLYTFSGQLITRRYFIGVKQCEIEIPKEKNLYLIKIETVNGKIALFKILKK